MTMPTSAPALSFLPLDTGGGDGDGDGDGAPPQLVNGAPHKSLFPVKLSAENFDKEEGMEPLRRLFATLKSLREDMFNDGIDPERVLFSRERD